ncbi:TonB-dependent receptor [Fulvivirga sp. M361]|uniref:TonB-dependent receptor n=1 Tax=Fulvivirga sp. M361 TaxID=2594266 RepID=UPI001623A06A|nr:TonB-dependent receptor [Fulvivirga sp. M361]
MSRTIFNVILVNCCLAGTLAAGDTKGQVKSLEEITISLEAREKVLANVLRDIEAATVFRFSYYPDDLDNKWVTVNARDQPIADVLRAISKQANLGFKRIDNDIYVRPLKNRRKPSVTENISAPATQSITITGRVTSVDGEGLPGVNILIKGNSTGTVTDVEGNYTLEVPNEETVLVFSFVGFLTEEIIVGSQSVINVKMVPNIESLEEVVVIGYGQVQKSDLSGAVSTIKAEDINNVPVPNFDQALQGRASGVFVTSTSGAPGANTTIRIRGGNSITAGNEPLFVIDGLIGGGNLSTINPEDIESIEILKDASAIAIYGARGANGVVLVTTKKGEADANNFTIHHYSGVQEIPSLIDMMNGREYAELVNEAVVAAGDDPVYDDPASIGEGTNWQEVATQSALITNTTISYSGGTKNTQAYISANYFDQEGVIKESGFKRYQFRANVNQKAADFIELGSTVNVSFTRSENNKTNLNTLLRLNPADPVYLDNGELNTENSFTGTFFSNPVADIEQRTDHTIRNRVFGGLFAKITFLENFTFRPSFNYNLSNVTTNIFLPGSLPNRAVNDNGGFARITQLQSRDFLTEHTLSYDKDIGQDHSINAVVGFTYQQDQSQSTDIQADQLFTDITNFNSVELAAADQRTINSGMDEAALVSWLGRINYIYKGKYIFTLTARQDGSSKFGANDKYAFFPSAAAAWNIGDEEFMRSLDIFDNLKLRASYGFSGNQGINSFQTIGALGTNTASFGGIEFVGLTQTRLPNPDLKWETTEQLDLGLEAGFFEGILNIEFDYFRKRTEDLLLDVELPFQVGFDSQLRNVGIVENRGFEFMINAIVVSKEDLKVELGLNISRFQNEVVFLNDGVEEIIIERSGLPEQNAASALIPGQPLGAFIGLEYLGTWKSQAEIDEVGTMPTAQPGDQRYGDYNNDGTVDANDAHVIGNPNPDFFGGLNTAVQYKNFQLNVFFQTSVGNDLYGRVWNDFAYGDTRANNYQFVVDRWSPENPTSDIPRADAVQNILSSTADVHDGSFLRLKTVNLAYNIPLKSQVLSNAQVYFTGTNLWLLKSDEFQGYDPEVNNVNTAGRSTLERGFYQTDYPQNRSFIFGVRVGF